jgi:hypothetical protein
MFELKAKEWLALRTQFASLEGKGKHSKYLGPLPLLVFAADERGGTNKLRRGSQYVVGDPTRACPTHNTNNGTDYRVD